MIWSVRRARHSPTRRPLSAIAYVASHKSLARQSSAIARMIRAASSSVGSTRDRRCGTFGGFSTSKGFSVMSPRAFSQAHRRYMASRRLRTVEGLRPDSRSAATHARAESTVMSFGQYQPAACVPPTTAARVLRM